MPAAPSRDAGHRPPGQGMTARPVRSMTPAAELADPLGRVRAAMPGRTGVVQEGCADHGIVRLGIRGSQGVARPFGCVGTLFGVEPGAIL
jgi:hypothetical protein